jgi:predicted phosphodiesterase
VRYGVLADVHANLAALEAVLRLLDRAGVDRLVCLGDLVGYGPQPDAVVERLAELRVLCVAGNHDLMAVGALPLDRAAPLARRTLAWTSRVLDRDTRAFLERLPRVASPVGGVVLAHGSLEDPERYVRTPQEAVEQLGRLAREQPRAELLLLGHTHVAAAVGERAGRVLHGGTGEVTLPRGERALLNPGSVGQSRRFSAAARALVLDTSARTASFEAVGYDTRAARRALRAEGLPRGALHRNPYAPRALARRAARRAIRVVR